MFVRWGSTNKTRKTYAKAINSNQYMKRRKKYLLRRFLHKKLFKQTVKS